MNQTPPPERTFIELALFFLSVSVAFFAVAFLAGLTAGMIERGMISLKPALALVATLAVLAGSVTVAFRTRPDLSLPKSPKMRMSRILLYVSLLIGAVTGAGLAISDTGETGGFRTLLDVSSPLPQSAAIVLILAVVVTLVLSIKWHVSLDEHERKAYDFGAVAALYGYFALSTIWWLAWRGGMTAQPDGHVIFWAVMALWLLGWFYRRFR